MKTKIGIKVRVKNTIKKTCTYLKLKLYNENQNVRFLKVELQELAFKIGGQFKQCTFKKL
jgi:hypothetical protein